MAIHGTHFWEVEPYAVIPPFMATFSGDGAVPVWFVPMSVMEAALQDGVLTIGELTGLSGLLVGYASRFNLSVPEACAHCGGADSSSFHPCAV